MKAYWVSINLFCAAAFGVGAWLNDGLEALGYGSAAVIFTAMAALRGGTT